MDPSAEQQQDIFAEGEQPYHLPRPNAEKRYYSVTLGRKPGVYKGM